MLAGKCESKNFVLISCLIIILFIDFVQIGTWKQMKL